VRFKLVFRAGNLASCPTSAHNITTQGKAHFINLAVATELVGLRLHHQDRATGGNPRDWHTACPHAPTPTGFQLH